MMTDEILFSKSKARPAWLFDTFLNTLIECFNVSIQTVRMMIRMQRFVVLVTLIHSACVCVAFQWVQDDQGGRFHVELLRDKKFDVMTRRRLDENNKRVNDSAEIVLDFEEVPLGVGLGYALVICHSHHLIIV